LVEQTSQKSLKKPSGFPVLGKPDGFFWSLVQIIAVNLNLLVDQALAI